MTGMGRFKLMNVIPIVSRLLGYMDPQWGEKGAPRVLPKHITAYSKASRRTFDWFEGRAPGRHSLHIVPGYGHLDVFIGEHADRDWHPIILGELARQED